MMEQTRFQNQLHPPSSKTLNNIDQDFTRINQPKKLKVDHPMKVHLFAYSEEYYSL